MATVLSPDFFFGSYNCSMMKKDNGVCLGVCSVRCWCLIINFFNGRALTPNVLRLKNENRYKRFSLAEHSTCNSPRYENDV